MAIFSEVDSPCTSTTIKYSPDKEPTFSRIFQDLQKDYPIDSHERVHMTFIIIILDIIFYLIYTKTLPGVFSENYMVLSPNYQFLYVE